MPGDMQKCRLYRTYAVRSGMKEAGASQLRIQKRKEIPLELRLIDWARSRRSPDTRTAALAPSGKLPPSRRQSPDVENTEITSQDQRGSMGSQHSTLKQGGGTAVSERSGVTLA